MGKSTLSGPLNFSKYLVHITNGGKRTGEATLNPPLFWTSIILSHLVSSTIPLSMLSPYFEISESSPLNLLGLRKKFWGEKV